MATYTKSLINDFHGQMNQAQLYDEIIKSTIIKINLQGISSYDDIVNIVFESTLSSTEELALNAIIANHIPKTIEGGNSNTFSVNDTSINTTTYKKLISFIFNGTQNMSLTNIKFIGYLQTGISYDIRVVDTTNNKIIATQNFTNMTESINDIGTLNNLPEKQSKFELQGKVNDISSSVHIESVTLLYN
jgi:hypothetical protein